jgi:hypothetical protein
MKNLKISLASSLCVIASATLISACVSEPSKNPASREVSSLSEQAPGETGAEIGATPQYLGCDGGFQRTMAERSAVLELAVRQAESEITKNPMRIRDPDFRSRVATFAAASVDDKVPLISIDRACWAEFYDGQKKLADGDESGAKANGNAWRICLEALFPNRVEIARRYFSCFNPDISRASAPSDL